jgi:uncharacterized protein (DUF4213/DUF364 family)
MADPREIYDLLLDSVDTTAMVEEVLIGQVWTCCRGNNIGLAMSPDQAVRTLPWSGTLAGRTVGDLAPWVKSWNAFEATIGMAAINAGIDVENANLRDKGVMATGPVGNLSVFEWFLPYLRNKRIAVIGRYPGIEHYQSELDLTVIERTPASGDLPDPACEYLLPEADWVFLTASSIINKTFPRLAELSADANLVLMGPSVPWLAELGEFGVDYLAGVSVEDPPALKQIVAEGGGVRIFDSAVQYRIVDLGRRQMANIESAISTVVSERDRIKAEMDRWYSGNPSQRFPKLARLNRLDDKLSALDTRYKRMWDARNVHVSGKVQPAVG